ncbi:MAG: hypothetical protein M3Y37_06415 [Chloroflexota bacterium]|nr:hypothetical protein [Chloroflexota bacterium]
MSSTDEPAELPEAPARAPIPDYSFFAESRSATWEWPEEPPRRNRRHVFSLIPVMVLLLIVAVNPFRTTALRVAGLAAATETPAPTVQPSGLYYCDDTSDEQIRAIELAAAEMRRTATGRHLQQTFADFPSCIGVMDMNYVAAFTTFNPNLFGSPSAVFIFIHPWVVENYAADELAAVLVHEATHAERLIDKTGCHFIETCQELPNGTFVEEEVAAHGAEAEFWMEIHGPDGTANGVSFTGEAGAAYLNRMLDRYLRGPEGFREYVIMIRSDMREADILPETPEASN